MTKTVMGPWHVAVAAEAVTAALFARCGCDVSVQYGADQPGYDLVVSRGVKLLKVSVKGSQGAGWGLTQTFLKGADYHQAIRAWLKKQSAPMIFSFVTFMGVAATEMPRVYLATPEEVAVRLHDTANGRGDTVLYEKHRWSARARGAGTTEEIPSHWVFSLARVEQMLGA